MILRFKYRSASDGRPNGEYGYFCQKIRRTPDLLVAFQKDLPFDDPALRPAKHDEVVDGQEVKIRGFMPFMWKEPSSWSTAARQVRDSCRPVPEVRKRNDAVPSHAQHLVQHA